MDDLVEELPKRQRWERTGKKDINVQVVVVPRKNDGQDNHSSRRTTGILEQQEDEEMQDMQEMEDEESKRVFSQVLARTTSKIKVPRVRRRHQQMEAYQRQAGRRIRDDADVPRLPSSIGSATYHVATTLSERDKEDALRYIISTPEEEERPTTTHHESSRITIFGALEDLGTTYRRQEENQDTKQQRAGGRHHPHPHHEDVAVLTDRQQRRRDNYYVKERIFPRRAQKNHDPGKYKSKILRTEQELDDGTIQSFLDFDLGWTMIEYPDSKGEKRLMLFSSLQVVMEEEAT